MYVAYPTVFQSVRPLMAENKFSDVARQLEEKLGEMNQANDLQLRRKVLADMRLVGSSRWLGAGK